MEFKTLQEAIDSIGYGLCSLCQAEHEFPDVKCDLMDGKEAEFWQSCGSEEITEQADEALKDYKEESK
jgi:hypothetical protein